MHIVEKSDLTETNGDIESRRGKENEAIENRPNLWPHLEEGVIV